MNQSYNRNDQKTILILKLPNMFFKINDKKNDEMENTPMITTFLEDVMTKFHMMKKKPHHGVHQGPKWVPMM
jgi:hypothetical protein